MLNLNVKSKSKSKWVAECKRGGLKGWLWLVENAHVGGAKGWCNWLKFNVGGTKGRLWLVSESKGSLWSAKSQCSSPGFPWLSGPVRSLYGRVGRLTCAGVCLSVRGEPRPARESKIWRSVREEPRIDVPQHSWFMSTQVCEGLCDTNTLTYLKLLPLFCRM